MNCLKQVAKFELVEMDDTIKNREKVFEEILTESIKETCLEYLSNVDSTLLESVKQEFEGKTFEVSQQMIWSNGQTSYNNQLEKFKNLKNFIDSKLEQFKSEQKNFISKTEHYEINSDTLILNENNENELKSALTEIILEGLCWVNPKILDKKDAGYVTA